MNEHGEKVLIIHEDEACMLLHSVREYVKSTHFDLADEESACEMKWMFDLAQKLTLYLDGKLTKDVRSSDECSVRRSLPKE